jgi:hypothetical protein
VAQLTNHTGALTIPVNISLVNASLVNTTGFDLWLTTIRVEGLDTAYRFRPLKSELPHTVTLGVSFKELRVRVSVNATLPGRMQQEVSAMVVVDDLVVEAQVLAGGLLR